MLGKEWLLVLAFYRGTASSFYSGTIKGVGKELSSQKVFVDGAKPKSHPMSRCFIDESCP